MKSRWSHSGYVAKEWPEKGRENREKENKGSWEEKRKLCSHRGVRCLFLCSLEYLYVGFCLRDRCFKKGWFVLCSDSRNMRV